MMPMSEQPMNKLQRWDPQRWDPHENPGGEISAREGTHLGVSARVPVLRLQCHDSLVCRARDHVAHMSVALDGNNCCVAPSAYMPTSPNTSHQRPGFSSPPSLSRRPPPSATASPSPFAPFLLLPSPVAGCSLLGRIDVQFSVQITAWCILILPDVLNFTI